MLAHVITAYLHFLGMMMLMATLLAEHVMLHTQMPPVHLQRVARTDLFYGMAVLVFSHPCFPQGRATVSEDGEVIQYGWHFSYFEQRKCVDPPWAHFTAEFIWFHRPLSDYWKACKAAGFVVVDFEEPSITVDRYPLAKTERQLKDCQTCPASVAFKLQKPQRAA